MVRREINTWVKRQLFARDCFALLNSSGKTLTINAREDLTQDQTLTLPTTGTLMAVAQIGNAADQPIAAVNEQIVLDQTSDIRGYITHVGNTLVAGLVGLYEFALEMNVTQGTNSSVFTAWPRINGVAPDNSAAVFEAKQAGDTAVVSATYLVPLAPGDVVDFYAHASANATLTHIPAAGGRPASFAAGVLCKGYLGAF